MTLTTVLAIAFCLHVLLDLIVAAGAWWVIKTIRDHERGLYD